MKPYYAGEPENAVDRGVDTSVAFYLTRRDAVTIVRYAIRKARLRNP